MSEDPALERARAISRTHAESLLSKANVIGVGVGFREGNETDPILVVMVSQKLPQTALSARDLLPTEIEGVPVQVRAVGEVSAQEEQDNIGEEGSGAA